MATNDTVMARQATTAASPELHSDGTFEAGAVVEVAVVLVDVSVVEVAVVEVTVNVDVLMKEATPSETMYSSALRKLPPFLGLWDQREYANPSRASTAAGSIASQLAAALRCKNAAIAVVFFQEATSAKPSSSRGAVAASEARMVQLPV